MFWKLWLKGSRIMFLGLMGRESRKQRNRKRGWGRGGMEEWNKGSDGWRAIV